MALLLVTWHGVRGSSDIECAKTDLNPFSPVVCVAPFDIALFVYSFRPAMQKIYDLMKADTFYRFISNYRSANKTSTVSYSVSSPPLSPMPSGNKDGPRQAR
jgi:hypothetical protein